MKLLSDLFSTDYGLMSIIGIGFMLCMGAFFVRMFLVKITSRLRLRLRSTRPRQGARATENVCRLRAEACDRGHWQ